MKDEELDIYDATGRHVGTAARDVVHREGLWHKTIHCWVINKEEGADYVVLQKRASTKKSWPGFLDITAAGHFRAGETLKDAVREIEEEIGIVVDERALISLGTRVCVEEFSPGAVNHEFQQVFFLIDNRNTRAYRQQKEELDGLLRVPIDDLLELFRGRVDTVSVTGVRPDGTPADFVVRREDFIPTLDNYNYKIAVLARRALRQELDLLI